MLYKYIYIYKLYIAQSYGGCYIETRKRILINLSTNHHGSSFGSYDIQKSARFFLVVHVVSWFVDRSIAAEEVDPGKLEWHELTGEEDDSVSEQEETISVWNASNMMWYHF